MCVTVVAPETSGRAAGGCPIAGMVGSTFPVRGMIWTPSVTASTTTPTTTAAVQASLTDPEPPGPGAFAEGVAAGTLITRSLSLERTSSEYVTYLSPKRDSALAADTAIFNIHPIGR
jgi:hypothetical protein